MRNFTLLTLLLFIAAISETAAQGCVAIRGLSSCSGSLGGTVNLTKGELLASTGFRYFKSFRHFRGHEEEAYRLEQGTEVINNSYFLDVSVTYGITDRWYANVVVPLVYHTRSSMYEHGGNPPNGLGDRHQTSSHGLSDMRLGAGYWLFDPLKENPHPFNYALGLGIKLPSGRYDYTDTFYNQGDNRDETREAVVDQSIQPGDGGLGFTVDMQGYHALSQSFILTANFFYLFNVQETNGIPTRNGRSTFSCPDQFAARVGAFYNTKIQGISAYIGGRVEGVPAEDLIGGSEGYRRPGYAVSVEPGLGYNHHRYSVNLSVPVALIRNRTQSFEDKVRTTETGNYVHGDAAFADYVFNLSFFYRFGGSHKMNEPSKPHWIQMQDVDL